MTFDEWMDELVGYTVRREWITYETRGKVIEWMKAAYDAGYNAGYETGQEVGKYVGYGEGYNRAADEAAEDAAGEDI